MELTANSAITKILPFQGWKSFTEGQYTIHAAGDFSSYKKMIALLQEKNHDLLKINELLKNEKSFFSLVIIGPEIIFANVDRIKSYPIFYGLKHQKLYVSNCSYTIKNDAQLNDLHQKGLLEFSMTSYTLANKTLYQSLYQLQAGEYLIFYKSTEKMITHRYYRYLPKEDHHSSKEVLMEEQANVMNKVIDRLIEKANGRIICLTLSGGLDSRILLTKLVEKKYDRLKVLSYGLRGNFEAKMAKLVADQLGVPWKFIAAKPRQAKKLYQTQERYEYAHFISALHTVPSYLEFEFLYDVTHQKIIPENSIIVNGQSGDFITGGHIPQSMICKNQINFDDLIHAAIKKHCSLWYSLVTPENVEYIRHQILEVFPDAEKLTEKEALFAYYESWEWQERQCKAVVKGQRLYDFFHYDWHLPLWDSELMDFWAKVPFKWKINQQLYIEYLQTYYPKYFKILRPIAKPWVLSFKWIPLVAKSIGLLFGHKKKNDFYKRMYYYGTDYNQYALIGREEYLAHYKNTHGLGPFLVSRALEEWGLKRRVD